MTRVDASARDAIAAAAEPTTAERAAAPPVCPCGTRHRDGSRVALEHAVLYAPGAPTAAPAAGTASGSTLGADVPEVTAADLRGCLQLFAGALFVVPATPKLAAHVFVQSTRGAHLPRGAEQLLDHDLVIGLLAESGAPVHLLADGASEVGPDHYEAAALLLAEQLRAEYALAA